jgi:hypothetical protein
MKINNRPVATLKTRSRTEIFIKGGQSEQDRRNHGRYLLKYLNNNFSVEEQLKIGNFIYDLDKKPSKKRGGESGLADVIEGNPNRNRKKIFVMTVHPSFKDQERVYTHELIHARKFASKQRHNEKKIEFETVGRITKKALDIMVNDYGGYYNSKLPKGMQNLPRSRREPLVKEGIIQDRILLTGNINKRLIGKKAVNRADEQYNKSFFRRGIVTR